MGYGFFAHTQHLHGELTENRLDSFRYYCVNYSLTLCDSIHQQLALFQNDSAQIVIQNIKIPQTGKNNVLKFYLSDFEYNSGKFFENQLFLHCPILLDLGKDYYLEENIEKLDSSIYKKTRNAAYDWLRSLALTTVNHTPSSVPRSKLFEILSDSAFEDLNNKFIPLINKGYSTIIYAQTQELIEINFSLIDFFDYNKKETVVFEYEKKTGSLTNIYLKQKPVFHQNPPPSPPPPPQSKGTNKSKEN
jgi:hypothetical protein